MTTIFWSDPLALQPDSQSTALIILNEPISSLPLLEQLWERASLRICADGGANRLFEACEKLQNNHYLPDLIAGDFDSLRPEIRQHYENNGVRVIHDPDQYSTDLGKCLKNIEENEQRKDAKYRVMLLGGLTGRLDQTAHTLSVLSKQSRSERTVWAFSEMSMACVLQKGHNVICVNRESQGPTCGILPLGCSTAHISTEGLEWDIEDWETSLEGQMSTSNHVMADQISVITDKPVVWTCELRLGSI